MRPPADVLIVGGAVTGCAAAYFLLAHMNFKGSVCVVEADPSYTQCATTRSVASIRHQFSTPHNVAMSMFGTTFFRQAHELLAVDGVAPALGFNESGYLFLATKEGMPVLQRNHAVQRSLKADVALLSAAQLRVKFPWLCIDDLAAASLGVSGEGWLDAHALMHGFRSKAKHLGAQFITGKVASLERQGRRVSQALLTNGERLDCAWVVNAAGTGARAIAHSAGISLPVQARKRCVFHFRSPAVLARCPLVVDPSGLYFRPEGQGFICGAAPAPDADPLSEDFEVDWRLWDERLWPALAQRVPGFESAKLISAWAGHYDVNVLDHNVILGSHPDVDNLIFANGFSGHGLQQSPAVGRAIAELIVDGKFRSLDLTAMGWQRVLNNQPLLELNVV